VTPYIGTTAQTVKTVSGSATSTTVTGLTTGQTYTFTVRASNASGSGNESAKSNSVTLSGAEPPSPPTNVVARPADESALVSWTPPTNDGDSPITGYTVTPHIGATTLAPTQAGASATSVTVTGLTNDASYTFDVTATNAIGTGSPSSPSSAIVPNDTLFDFQVPSNPDDGDTSSVVLGVKFKATSAGSATGVRFYKSAANTGTHVGTLWSATGTKLAEASFTNETASGWQTVLFASPVALTPNTTYVVSYLAPNGHYGAQGGLFASSPLTNGPLTALDSPTSPNGVFVYSSTSAFPTGSWNATNYWVDVMFREGS